MLCDRNDMFNKIKNWLSDTNPAPEEILKTIAAPDQDCVTHVLVGLAILEHIAAVVPRIVIKTDWENVIWTVIQTFENAHATTCKFRHRIKTFIANALCSPSTCPDPYIRIEMMGSFFSFGCMLIMCKDSDLAKIAEAFVTVMTDINIDALEVHLGSNLFCNAKNVKDLMNSLLTRGHLSHIGERILDQIEHNKPRRELYFFINIIKLIGRLSLTASNKIWNSKHFKQPISCKLFLLCSCISLLNNGLDHLFNEDSAKFRKVCQHSILLPYITNSISEITHSILTIHSQILSSKEMVKYTWKVQIIQAIRLRDILLEELELPTCANNLPAMHLQWQHGGYRPPFLQNFMNTVSTCKNGVLHSSNIYK
ncbi:unnamed protein product [Meganyctiphanes norvegica]|uniref:Uncharacterized protein n=1 Tax=Meganyctiphanes norvegica TaxID=48144 RepID=A0AAV2RJ32_MEGNR